MKPVKKVARNIRAIVSMLGVPLYVIGIMGYIKNACMDNGGKN